MSTSPSSAGAGSSPSLVTGVVYGLVRHPSYLGLVGNLPGWSLPFRSGTGVLLTVLIVPSLIARIRAEESVWSSEFGVEYEAYRGTGLAADSGSLLSAVLTPYARIACTVTSA